MKKAWARWLVAAAALPAALPLFAICKYGVDLPYLDEWDPKIIGLAVKAHQHQLTLFDFTAQHNEHRMAVTKLIYLLVNLLTRGNNLAIQFTTWLMTCLASAAILWFCMRTADRIDTGPDFAPHDSSVATHPRLSTHVLLLWFMCNTVLFNLVQQDTWMWGICLMNVTPFVFIVAALIILTSKPPRWTAILPAMLLATAATFSSGNGILAWPLGGALLAWSTSVNELKSKLGLLAAWITGFGLNLWLIFHHYVQPVAGKNPAYTFDLLRILHYFVSFLGNLFAMSVGNEMSLSTTIAGTVLLVLFLPILGYFFYAWLKWRDFELCRRMLVWITIAGFGILSGAMAAIGRAGLGVQQANDSRYVTYSMYLVVGLINLAPMVCIDIWRRTGRNPQRRWLLQVSPWFGGALIALLVVSLPTAFGTLFYTQTVRLQLKSALLCINVIPDPLLDKMGANSRAELSAQANALNAIGYIHPPLISSNNAADIAVKDPATLGGVEGKMEGLTARPGTNQIIASGWAYLKQTDRHADAVFLTCTDDGNKPIMFVSASIVQNRPDLVQQGNPQYEWAGWHAEFSSADLPPMPRIIQIQAWVFDASQAKAFKLDGDFAIRRN